jgi:hypothetical protein
MNEKKLTLLEKRLYRRLVTQFLEWLGTLTTIVGVGVNALGHHPEGVIIMITGASIWIVVGYLWRTWSIVTVNAAIAIVSITGLTFYYV